MFPRILTLPKHSFFLFGPRGVGKSTWVLDALKKNSTLQSSIYINLLDPKSQRNYKRNPERLVEEVEATDKHPHWVIIDEVQKIPELLDVVHLLIEKHGIHFILLGSSARKLKRSGVNLLAGRAFVENMYPLTYIELGKRFSLEQSLNWGVLPKLFQLEESKLKEEFLFSYTTTYLKEEILQELLIRKAEPFEEFLEIAAQMEGKFINYSKIAEDVNVDHKSIQVFYQILEDTLIGFRLPSFHLSARKRQKRAPKFYFFDLGVRRALENQLDVKLKPRTYEWGRAFETFVIQQAMALNSYHKRRFEFFTWQEDTKEVDLILKKGKEFSLVEIKSAKNVDLKEIKKLENIRNKYFPKAHAIILSCERSSRKVGSVLIFPWEEGLSKLFLK